MLLICIPPVVSQWQSTHENTTPATRAVDDEGEEEEEKPMP